MRSQNMPMAFWGTLYRNTNQLRNGERLSMIHSGVFLNNWVYIIKHMPLAIIYVRGYKKKVKHLFS